MRVFGGAGERWQTGTFQPLLSTHRGGWGSGATYLPPQDGRRGMRGSVVFLINLDSSATLSVVGSHMLEEEHQGAVEIRAGWEDLPINNTSDPFDHHEKSRC